VTARDSDATVAYPEDLFTAIAEDEAIWPFFKRMQGERVFDRRPCRPLADSAARLALEETCRPRQKRSQASRQANRATGRVSAGGEHDSQTSLVQSSSSGLIREQEKKTSLPPSTYDARASRESPNSGSVRKSPSIPTMGSRFGQGVGSSQHIRSPSVLSANTRSMIGAYHDQAESGNVGRSKRDEEEDFDALLAGGETMKVSLTPSRLKNFDVSVIDQFQS
jgi:hypothetical protein